MIVGALKNRVEISIITLSVVFFSLFISLFSISHSFYEISGIQSSLFNKFVFFLMCLGIGWGDGQIVFGTVFKGKYMR
jgi:hypothetical protein